MISIDTVDNCSFLNVDKLTELRNIISKCGKSISACKKRRDSFKVAQQYLTFQSVFSNLGVQGITGILKLRGRPEETVFKLSVELNKTVEHEAIVINELNKLRPYCPHFVASLGMINLPISNDFINDPKDESLFKCNDDYFPCNVLLLEYVSPISFYYLCKYLYSCKSLIISFLSQILMALDIAQTECKLTSYDLHLDNILVRNIEEDSLFLYRHKGRNLLLPTYGMYPVIIDLGSSYVGATEGKPMYTSVYNYHNGLQPTLYDNLNDIHHLLISTLDYLHDKEYVYDWLRTRFMHIFRHVPVLVGKGWKQLPYNILKITLNSIVEQCPTIYDIDIFYKCDGDIIDILNGLIILPWSDTGRNDFSALIPLMEEIQKISDAEVINSNDDVLYILREIVDCINNQRGSTDDENVKIHKFTKELKSKILFIFHDNMKEINKLGLDYQKIYHMAIEVSNSLSTTYFKYINKHCDIISQSYLKTDIKGPWDAIKILLQNATPAFEVTNGSKLYIWDSHKKNKKVVTINVTSEQLEMVNKANILNKGDVLLDLLGIDN